MPKIPNWINHRFPTKEEILSLKPFPSTIHTVCEEARCPNIRECFQNKIATFLILGNICTRRCKFCAIKKGIPMKVDKKEPRRISKIVKKMNLKYVVITSVTRDDLEDEGSLQFVTTIKHIKNLTPKVKIETLLPLMREENLLNIVKAQPEVIGYNIETIPRHYRIMRPQFSYKEGLNFLRKIKKLSENILLKSGIMVGLGEKKEEVVNVMQDLRKCKVDIITIGQYFRPPGGEISPVTYITPAQFKKYEIIAYDLGFKKVFSGPYIRSSYQSWKIVNIQ